MGDGGKKRTVKFDTATTQSAADDMRHEYASLLEANGLTDRFGVSVKPEFHKLKTHNFYTYDLVLTDRHPDKPIPAFLQSDKFRLKKASSGAPKIAPAPVPDEEEEVSLTRRPRGALYSYDGERHTLPEWSRLSGVPYPTLIRRLDVGNSLGEALTRPVQKRTKRTG